MSMPDLSCSDCIRRRMVSNKDHQALVVELHSTESITDTHRMHYNAMYLRLKGNPLWPAVSCCLHI